jgi:hypothetical protein
MMGDLEDFKAEGFTKYLETKGICLVTFMDENTEIPYDAKCFINPKGTMGYAEVDIKEKHEFIFLSKTAKGDVVTMTGDQPGPLPIQAPGYFAIYGVPPDSPIEVCYATHRKALGEEAPLADENWLKVETPKLPQRTLDIAMIAMGQVLEALGGVDGLMQNMANAMTGAMEGLGKGLEQAFSGDGQVEIKNDWDKPPEQPEPMEGEPKNTPRPKPHTTVKKASKAKPKPAKKAAPKPKQKAKPKAKPAKKAKAKPKKKKR